MGVGPITNDAAFYNSDGISPSHHVNKSIIEVT